MPLNEQTGYFEHTASRWLRDSPTMSADAAITKAKKDYGKNPVSATVGDLFPKPSMQQIADWKAKLRAAVDADAALPADQRDPKFALRGEKNYYAYTTKTGLPAFQAAAAEVFSRDTGFNVTAADVGVGNGGKGALNGALYNRFDAGDVVFVAGPSWPSNFDMFPPGVIIVELPTKDGLPRAEDVAKASEKYPHARGLLVNAPSNPTSANYAAGEREALFAEVAKHPDLFVFDDNPYGKLVFDEANQDVNTVLRRGPNEKALFDEGRIAVFRTISKEYGLAGGRCGFVVTKERTVNNEPGRPPAEQRKGVLDSLGKWNQGPGGGIAADSLELGQAALLYGDDFIRETVNRLRDNRQILTDGIAELNKFGVSMDKPAGTIYGWVDFSGLKGLKVPKAMSETGEPYVIQTPADKDRFLVNVAEVCGVPGVPFYAPRNEGETPVDDWHQRISFCLEPKDLQKLVDNLRSAVKTLSISQKNGVNPDGV